jgi:hypothetical protein
MFAAVTGWKKEAIEGMSNHEFLVYAPLVEMVFRNQSGKL